MAIRDERGHFVAGGGSGNPEGTRKLKPMTDALQLYLLRPADLPRHKPRNAAEAIAEKMVSQAVSGCTTSQSAIYDRMEGKALQTIKDETERAPMDIMEAARRLAFALNSAALLGQPVDDRFAKLVDVTPAQPELDKIEGNQ